MSTSTSDIEEIGFQPTVEPDELLNHLSKISSKAK